MESEFVFKFRYNDTNWSLKAAVTLPMEDSTKEFAFRLIHAHKLPNQLEAVLIKSLKDWLAVESDKCHEKCISEVLEKFTKFDENETEKLVSSWEQSYIKEHLEYMGVETITNEEVFSEMYHALAHSPALDTLLSLEHSYAVQIANLVSRRDEQMNKLQNAHSEELEQAIEQVGISTTDKVVNELAVKHLEEVQMVNSRHESEISALGENQIREFKKWVGTVHEDYHIFPQNTIS
ncbi:hypothetical protein CHUAL_014210 [Chamberlinius hualienensis]